MSRVQDFEFIVDVPPDNDTLERASRVIAEAFVEKYGVENMKLVLEELKRQEEQ